MKPLAAFFTVLISASLVFAASEDEYLKQGYKDLNSDNLQGAVRKFKQAVRANPQRFDAHKGLGLAYFRMGNTPVAVTPAIVQDSIAAFSEAISIKPEAETYYHIGIAQLALARPDDAEIIYKKLVQLDRAKSADLAAKIAACSVAESKKLRYRPTNSQGAAPSPRSKKGIAVTAAQPATPKKERFTGTVELYVTDWCGYCRQAEDYLQSNGIPYVAYDIEKDREANQRHKELGGRGVPLIIIGSNRMSGFSPASLEYYMNNSR